LTEWISRGSACSLTQAPLPFLSGFEFGPELDFADFCAVGSDAGPEDRRFRDDALGLFDGHRLTNHPRISTGVASRSVHRNACGSRTPVDAPPLQSMKQFDRAAAGRPKFETVSW
jgi:hypothetical protein